MKINAFGKWYPKHEWPKIIVPNFSPSRPTYAQILGDGTGMTEDDFQAVGSSWMIRNPCGILGDVMGLGKCKMTLDAIMHVALAGQEAVRNVIIVCEASNIDTWLDELDKFYPNQPKFAFRGSRRSLQYEEFRNQSKSFPRFVIMSYAIYRVSQDMIVDNEFDWAILDEGHVIRGNQLNGIKEQSQIAKLIHELHPKRRHILSGTPIINTPADWHNIGRWIGVEQRRWKTFERETLIVMAIKTSRWRVQRKIVGEVPEGLALIKHTIETCMLRRTKEVLKDLPSIRKTNRYVRMLPKEVKTYNAMKARHADAVQKLANGDEPGINPQVAEMRMKQLTSSIASKVDVAMTIVNEAVGADQKVLIFTQHLETLRMLYLSLEKHKQKFVYIHGGVSTDANTGEQSERGKAVHAFQDDPTVKVLIGTSQACRVGLTLTAASVVILMDEEFSPEYVKQLIDRAHRIGQKNAVLVISLEAVIQFGTKLKRTIEAQLRRRLLHKANVINGVVQTSSFSQQQILDALEDDEFYDDQDDGPSYSNEVPREPTSRASLLSG